VVPGITAGGFLDWIGWSSTGNAEVVNALLVHILVLRKQQQASFNA
jgi:hypothetical protein